jgi:hypothetical protein
MVVIMPLTTWMIRYRRFWRHQPHRRQDRPHAQVRRRRQHHRQWQHEANGCSLFRPSSPSYSPVVAACPLCAGIGTAACRRRCRGMRPTGESRGSTMITITLSPVQTVDGGVEPVAETCPLTQPRARSPLSVHFFFSSLYSTKSFAVPRVVPDNNPTVLYAGVPLPSSSTSPLRARSSCSSSRQCRRG